MELRTKLTAFLDKEIADEAVRIAKGETNSKTKAALEGFRQEALDYPIAHMDELWLQGIYETLCDTTNTRDRGCDSDFACAIAEELATMLGVADWTGEAEEE